MNRSPRRPAGWGLSRWNNLVKGVDLRRLGTIAIFCLLSGCGSDNTPAGLAGEKTIRTATKSGAGKT